MERAPVGSRFSRRGYALITVLASAALIAGLVLTLRTRVHSGLVVMSRIEEMHRFSLVKWSVAEELHTQPRVWLARERATVGAPVTILRDGRRWEVLVTDVEGLVDLYLAPPQVLALLTGDGRDLERRRNEALAGLPPGARFASEEQTLARFGFDAAERARLGPLVTQRARTGEINLTLAPSDIRTAASAFLDGDTAGGDLVEITIRPLQ